MGADCRKKPEVDRRQALLPEADLEEGVRQREMVNIAHSGVRGKLRVHVEEHGHVDLLSRPQLLFLSAAKDRRQVQPGPPEELPANAAWAPHGSGLHTMLRDAIHTVLKHDLCHAMDLDTRSAPSRSRGSQRAMRWVISAPRQLEAVCAS